MLPVSSTSLNSRNHSYSVRPSGISTDVNEAPEPTDDTATTLEDESVSIGVLANDSDPEGDALSVRLRSAPHNGSATVDATTNEVTYTPHPHYHGADSFTYTVSDGGLTSRQATVNVTVAAVNDPPVFPAATTTRTVSQDARPGANVGRPLTATDADGDVLTYSLTGVAASDFEIEEHTGQITLRQGTVLDAGTQPSYSGAVAATDPSFASATTNLTITVTTSGGGGGSGGGGSGGGGGGGGGGGFAAFAPVNSEPAFIAGTRTDRTVPEDAEPEADIGLPVTATDADGDELTYTLHGDDADFFTVLAGTGQLRVQATLDFEARESYSLRVQADDGKGGVDTVQVTVTVTDVNEPPLVTGPAMLEYAENGADAVASYTAVDPESGEVTWSLAGDDAGVFSLSATGTLAFELPPDYETPDDADSDNRYRLTVQATDSGGVLGALDLEIVITDDEDESIVRHYDVDRNGIIDRPEVVAAVVDYFDGVVSKEEAIAVVTVYFAG